MYWGQTDVVWPPFLTANGFISFLSFRLFIRQISTIKRVDYKMSFLIQRGRKYCVKNDRIFLFIINRYTCLYLK
ncbi:hypothetical protein D8M09_15430 [Enterobacter sp. R1(2018)]|nr:hypothetical protein D8M09_15430 [Enterobacter sp. R1(2018)]